MRVEFGRAICGDLAAAERREWLTVNGLGGFASGTIAGSLTRRYHGLLIAAFRPPGERTLVLTKFDETVRYRGTEYALATNRWRDGYLAPQGFAAIERFYLDGTIPVWEFALADALLEKRVWLEAGANTVYVRYRAVRAAAPLELSLLALANYRDFHGNTHAGNRPVRVVPAGARTLRVEAGPRPLWIAAGAGSVTVENVWYRDFVLARETQRGLDDRDDNLAAGTFVATLAPLESLALAAGTDADPSGFAAGDALDRRRAHDAALAGAYRGAAGPADAGWIRRCALAADQFVVKRPVETNPDALTAIAGYHWFGDWGRDTMIALPGLTLVTGRPEIARSILISFSGFVDGGMLPNFFPGDGEQPAYNTVDAALWYIEAAARYLDATRDAATLRTLWPSLQDVIAHYRSGTRYGIRMDADGLVTAGVPGMQLTWMDAKIGDWVVTPRIGKPVEIGALWYNALERMHALAGLLGDAAGAAQYASLAQTARDGFARFWNDAAQCCYDVIDGPAGNDASLRPNQVFAVSLPHSPLAADRQRAVVDVCAAQLLTSLGLRSLAPSDPRFAARYEGPPATRDAAYHQGTVWTWLLGPFALAHARVYRDAALARSFLRPLVDALGDEGLGTLGEIADGAAPFTQRGAIAQAWSVAELLRAWHEIPAMAQGAAPAPRQ